MEIWSAWKDDTADTAAAGTEKMGSIDEAIESGHDRAHNPDQLEEYGKSSILTMLLARGMYEHKTDTMKNERNDEQENAECQNILLSTALESMGLK